MSKSQKSASDILCSAISLFEKKGYSQTSMRQIALESDVSLGLINHYFSSKARLGEITLNLIASQVSGEAAKMISSSGDPVLYDAVITRTANEYLLNGIYRQFYLDCLGEDVFWEFLSERTVNTLPCIMKKQGRSSLSEDELNLYGKYLPYSVEKTLVLNKEKGLFQTIPYSKIPDYILQMELEHFVDAFTLNTALEFSRKYTQKILSVLPEKLPHDYICSYCAHM